MSLSAVRGVPTPTVPLRREGVAGSYVSPDGSFSERDESSGLTPLRPPTMVFVVGKGRGGGWTGGSVPGVVSLSFASPEPRPTRLKVGSVVVPGRVGGGARTCGRSYGVRVDEPDA